ncbi:MAG: DUF5723 family protein [Saprospiraceae bacterium]
MNFRSSLFLCIPTILLFVSIDGSGQSFDYFNDRFSSRDRIFGLKLDNYLSNNTLVGSFVLDYINGNFITEEEKNKCISNFGKDQIKFAEIFNTAASYQKRIGKSKYFFGLEVGEHVHYETEAHRDLFVLLFKGNKIFENKSASLDPLQIRLLQYLFLKVSLSKEAGPLSFYASIGYTGGQRLLDLKTNKGSLFTANEGKYVDLNLGLTSIDVSPAATALFSLSGSGMIVDGGIRYDVSKSTRVSLDLNGLGYIKWNKGITERIVDTAYRFEGVVISNVLDSVSIAIKNVEELKSSFISERELDHVKSTLPFTVSFGLSQFIIPERVQFGIKYQYLNSDISKHFYALSLNYYLSKNLLVGMNANIAGFGNWNIGPQLALTILDRMYVHFYFNSLSNLVDPDQPVSLTGGINFKIGL